MPTVKKQRPILPVIPLAQLKKNIEEIRDEIKWYQPKKRIADAMLELGSVVSVGKISLSIKSHGTLIFVTQARKYMLLFGLMREMKVTSEIVLKAQLVKHWLLSKRMQSKDFYYASKWMDYTDWNRDHCDSTGCV